MSFPSLYSICFDYIKDHTEDIVSLDGIPFKPVVENILRHLFTTNTPLNSSILSVIANSHPKDLREAQFTWTSVLLSKASNRSAVPALTAISKHFPTFITCLKLGQSNLGDQDILLLRGFTNLKTLHLGKNPNITNRGMLYLTSITSAAPNIRLSYLEELHLSDLPGITDKSLKFIGKISTLLYIDITNTNIIDVVALRFLKKIGYRRVNKWIKPFEIDSAFDMLANMKFYRFIKDMAFQYDQGQVSRPLTAEDTPNSIQPKLHFSRTATSIADAAVEQEPANKKELVLKKRRLNTKDYLAMIEKEMFDDDSTNL
ncbi:hypothetical protein [Parasitella parasitica]|uniref:Uncharacterized protein n=1 Tax=Parasitella parasitica TaxID=35722 RepID=A0A0B7N8L8_9FUNG|nr:hypothetical protein [Parasitella parasitica]